MKDEVGEAKRTEKNSYRATEFERNKSGYKSLEDR
jgi:hypothetical protein